VPERGAYCFEQPLSERIRTLLRLEHLLTRLRYHERDDSLWGRRATMTALIDILTIMARHDLRTEISKALGSSYARLNRQAQQTESAQIRDRLDHLDDLGRTLQRIPPHFASYQLRDNDLLNSLNNRHAIPGGTCAFDVPSFQHWLRRDNADIQRDIDHWCRHIVPFEQSTNTLLQILRDSVEPQQHEARGGVLVHQSEKGTQLIRVLVDDATVYPEISAGRHRATVRFMEFHDADLSVRQCRSNIPLQLACCRL